VSIGFVMRTGIALIRSLTLLLSFVAISGIANTAILFNQLCYLKDLLCEKMFSSRFRARMMSLRNLRMDIRPLSLRQPVRIKNSDLVLFSPRPVYDGVPYVYPWDNVNWQVEYENTTRAIMPFTYEQSLNGASDSARTQLLGKDTAKVSTILGVPSPKTLSASARVIILKQTVDSVDKSFDVGILQFKEKPVAEWPEKEGSNGDFSRYGSYEAYKYLISQASKPDPNLPFETSTKVEGAIPFEGTHYRPPLGTLTFYVTFKVTNKYTVDKIFDITGPYVYTIYEDKLHNTSVVGKFRGRFTIPHGESRTFTFGQSVPKWVYGTIFVWSIAYINIPPYSFADCVPCAEFKIGDLIPPS